MDKNNEIESLKYLSKSAPRPNMFLYHFNLYAHGDLCSPFLHEGLLPTSMFLHVLGMCTAC